MNENDRCNLANQTFNAIVFVLFILFLAWGTYRINARVKKQETVKTETVQGTATEEVATEETKTLPFKIVESTDDYEKERLEQRKKLDRLMKEQNEIFEQIGLEVEKNRLALEELKAEAEKTKAEFEALKKSIKAYPENEGGNERTWATF